MVKRGLSLLEVTVTLSIVSMLTSIAIPQITRAHLRAREHQMRANLITIRQAMDRMMADTGSYPISLADLTSNVAPTTGFPQPQPIGQNWTTEPINPNSWRGPYLLQIPFDPVAQSTTWIYQPNTATVEVLRSSATWTSSEGTAYNTW